MEVKTKTGISGHVKIYSLPPDFTYEDFKKLDDKNKYLVNEGDNLVVDTGIQQLLLLAIGSNTNSFTLCGVGTGTTAPVATDTALGTSLGTNTINSRYRMGNTVYFETFFGKNDEAGTWAETCILTAGSVMLCRKLISPTFAKSTSNAAVISWQITGTATAD